MPVEKTTPQLVKKGKGKKRPGYRGPGEYQGGRGYGGSKSSKGGDKGTGGSKGNLGGGGGGQDSDYRSYSPPTKKTYTSKTIDTKPVTGDDYRRSRDNFVNTLNRNNQIAAERAGTRFTPYQGGARMQRSNSGLGSLVKFLAGLAIPGAGFLLSQGGKLKDGLMGLNDSIQNSDFGKSTSLMDYLDMKKFGGFDERELARQKTMQSSRNLQADIDAGMYDGPSRVNPTFQNDLDNELMLSTQKTPERFLPNAGPRQVNIPAGDAVSYVPFSNYGKANAATGTTVDGVPLEEFVKNAAIAPTPVEQYKDKAYTGIQENVGKPISNFLNNLMNADQIAALENQYGSKYGITNTAGGIASDARHMAAMNELSKSLSPMDNKFGNFIGDTLAFGAGAINEIPALFRGLDSKNLGEIKEDIIANYKGSFGTPNQTTAEQIYGDVFEGSTPVQTASVPTYGTASAEDITIDGGMLNSPFMETQIGPRIIAAENAYYNQGKMPSPFLADKIRMNMELGNARGFMGPGFADGGIASMFTRRG